MNPLAASRQSWIDVVPAEAVHGSREHLRSMGLIPGIAGGAKGYNETHQIPFHTVDGYDLNDLWNEFNESIGLMNRNRSELIDRLTFEVNKPIERVPQIFTEDFEEADEFGRPKGIRPGEWWDMGYDLRYFDIGIRYSWRFLGEADARQVRQLNNAALEADRRLMYRTVMNRLFDNTTWQATLRGGTAVNVYPFYNGDDPTNSNGEAVTPPTYKSFTFTANHDHYLVSGGATVDSGDLWDMYRHIYHHGYTEGDATIILLVSEQEADVITGFSRANGDRYDFIPAANNGISFILDGQIVGGQPRNDTGLNGFPGFLGKYGPISIVQEDLIPADYMVMFASGGLRAENNPIGLRQHDNASLRGLKLIPAHVHYPLVDSYYHHPIGSGVRHRGAGVVMQVKASGSYEVPDIVYGGPGGR